MDQTSVTISCNELHVFDEDAAAFATAEPEFVPVPIPHRLEPALPDDIAAARDCWLKIIRRFTRAVPGKKNFLRVRDGITDEPPILVRRAQPFLGTIEATGVEINATDKTYLILFGTESRSHGIEVVTTTIPWIEVHSITFRVLQPEAAAPVT